MSLAGASLAAALVVALASAGEAGDEDPLDEMPPENLLDPAQLLDLEEVDTSDVERFRFHGRIDFTYAWFEGQNPVEDFDRSDGLLLHPGLWFAWAFTDWLEAIAEIEYDGLEREVEIDRALLELEFLEDHFVLGLGRSILPFGIERFHYAPSRNVLVDRPAAFRVIFPGTFSDWGIFAGGHVDGPWGTRIELEGAASFGFQDAFDTSGKSLDLEDNNNRPQFTGRIGFFPVPSLGFGTSYLVGVWDEEGEEQVDFLGFDVSWKYRGFRLRGEWVGGEAQTGETGVGSLERQGWYVEFGHAWEVDWPYLRGVELAVRYDWIDPDKYASDTRDVRRWAIGGAFEIAEGLRWKIEYEKNDDRGREIPNDGLFTQIEYHW